MQWQSGYLATLHALVKSSLIIMGMLGALINLSRVLNAAPTCKLLLICLLYSMALSTRIRPPQENQEDFQGLENMPMMSEH